jgi:hypothetical protein
MVTHSLLIVMAETIHGFHSRETEWSIFDHTPEAKGMDTDNVTKELKATIDPNKVCS